MCLYARKLAVSENVLTSIEKVLLKSPARYKYTEVIPKTFVIPGGQQSWKYEDIFSKEPIRRMAIAMNTNTAFAGSNDTNPYHYQKFDLRSITIFRNGTPIVGTPLDTVDDKRLYIQSLTALAFANSGHGINLANFPNHFVMVFDLTSTEEASKEFIHPELTGTRLSIELMFGGNLANPVEILFIGEKESEIYINSDKGVSKNVLTS